MRLARRGAKSDRLVWRRILTKEYTDFSWECSATYPSSFYLSLAVVNLTMILHSWASVDLAGGYKKLIVVNNLVKFLMLWSSPSVN